MKIMIKCCYLSCSNLSTDLLYAEAVGKLFRFFSNLVGEEGPRIPGVKDSRFCFIETLSAPLTSFDFLDVFLTYPFFGVL